MLILPKCCEFFTSCRLSLLQIDQALGTVCVYVLSVYMSIDWFTTGSLLFIDSFSICGNACTLNLIGQLGSMWYDLERSRAGTRFVISNAE